MTSTDFHASSIAVMSPGQTPALTPAEKTAAVARVRFLENQVFDDSGHVRRGFGREATEGTVAEINYLRHQLGWLQIDLDGRWRWPG